MQCTILLYAHSPGPTRRTVLARLPSAWVSSWFSRAYAGAGRAPSSRTRDPCTCGKRRCRRSKSRCTHYVGNARVLTAYAVVYACTYCRRTIARLYSIITYENAGETARFWNRPGCHETTRAHFLPTIDTRTVVRCRANDEYVYTPPGHLLTCTPHTRRGDGVMS